MKKRLDKVFSKAHSKNRIYQPTLARLRVQKKKNSKPWWQTIYNLFF